MAFQISRLYDFTAGTKAASGQVDAEFDQLIQAHNGTDLELTNYIALLLSGLGAAEIGTKGNKKLDSAVISDDVNYIRISEDDAIEVSSDGVNWVITGSSGHLIYDKDSNLITQRSRMKFANSTVTDDGTYTIINGIKGDQGLQGNTGPIGPEGTPGVIGPTGPVIVPSIDPLGVMSFDVLDTAIPPQSVSVKGPQGVQGLQGVQGIQGVQGPQGPQGIQGPLGPMGPEGQSGIQGTRGLQGNEGPQGTRGLKGDTGDTGAKGDTGLTGAQGGTGIQGPLGPQGLKGDKGTDGTSFAIKGIYTTLLALQTAHPTGSVGDAYAVGTEISNLIYNWSIDTSNWVNLGSLQGPQGAQGIQGVQGEQGIQGTIGQTGETGAQGDQGIQGIQGSGYYPQGAWAVAIPYVNDVDEIDTVYLDGSSYYCKLSHTSTAEITPLNTTYWGIMALKGDMGDDGAQGVKGDQGIQGIQGIQGLQGEPSSVNNISAVDGNITLNAGNIPVTDTGGYFTATDTEGVLAELFQSANDGKTVIASAITAKGIAASVADTFSALATKIATVALVLTSDATAIASQMLSGVTAYINGTKITGTIASKGVATYTPSTVNQTIAAGQYLSGIQTISGDADLVSTNIKAGANIFGVAGNANVVDTSAGDATAVQILAGKKAYIDGTLITGTAVNKAVATITPSTANQTIAANTLCTGVQTILGDADLVAGNIKEGIPIFGVTGNVVPVPTLLTTDLVFENSNGALSPSAANEVFTSATYNCLYSLFWVRNNYGATTINISSNKQIAVSNNYGSSVVVGTSFSNISISSYGTLTIYNPSRATVSLTPAAGYANFYVKKYIN